MGHVHPEAGDAAVQPEAQDALEFVVDGVVVPVEVRLGGVEEVQVPLAGCAVRFGDPGPGRTAKVGSQLFGGSSPEAPVPSRKMNMSRSGLPGLRPGQPGKMVLVRAVVGDQVHDHPDAEPVGLGHHSVEVAERAEQRVHVAVVADVVAGVALRGR